MILSFKSVGSTLLRSYFRRDDRNETLYSIGSSLASLGSGLTVAGIVCVSVGSSGYYLSSTPKESSAYELSFKSNSLKPNYNSDSNQGNSVRLVRDEE